MRADVCALALALVALATPGAAEAQTCRFRGTPEALSERPSPLDSVSIELGDGSAMLCYGRPSARGRSVVGDQDPYGAPWRMGANEPTTIHLPFAARIGEVEVGPGSYSLYAIPEQTTWTIVVNGNTDRWGIPISSDVRSADLGSFAVPAKVLDEHVETLVFTFRPAAADSGELVLQWELFEVALPIARR